MTAMVLEELIDKAWTLARGVEPIRGVVTRQHVEELRIALEAADKAAQAVELPDDDVAELETMMSALFARSAVVAIAGGSEAVAARWFEDAKEWATDADELTMLEAAARGHERYRALVHGRYLMAPERQAAARKAWKDVAAVSDDVLGKAATAELAAPRPIRARDQLPTLRRVNGIGAAFYGRRDEWPDGSYATTHCISVLWVPLIALSAWRVRDTGSNSYSVMAREQLSTFARMSRLFVLGAVIVAITGYGLSAHYSDPTRLAHIRFDDAVAEAASSEPQAALRQLDGALAELSRIDRPRAEHAGAEVIRLTAGFAPKPFTARDLDQANRLANRYRALPADARGGEATDAVIAAVDGWLKELGDSPAVADARLSLLRLESDVAMDPRKSDIDAKIISARLAVATAKAADAPLDALAVLVDGPSDAAAITEADKIVARLVGTPAVLVNATAELETWAVRTHDTALRDNAKAQHDLAVTARDEATAEGVTPKQLAAMLAKQPWNQFATMMLAKTDAMANKTEAAIARLVKLGPASGVIREARFMLGQLVAEQGKLDEADAILTGVIGSRLPRYAAASAAFHEAVTAAETRLKGVLDAGNVPASMRAAYEAAPENQRDEVVRKWFDDQMTSDPKITAARDVLVQMSDVVPVSLAAGSLKLRRAQVLTGTARNAMLEEAERMFLAIKADAEGQPEFRLGLGEIYARLGKVKESDAELAAVLANKDSKLSLAVAQVYRNIGSNERAKEISTEVYNTAAEPAMKHNAAILLGVITADDDDVSESWFRKAEPTLPFVKTSLLEIEASRLARKGKHAECAAKYAEAAKAHLASAGPDNRVAFNNAAVAHQYRFACSGDLQALRDAEAALAQAYHARPDEPLVVGNYSGVLEHEGQLRVLAKRVDVRALRLTAVEAEAILSALVGTPERDALLAEVGADASLRQAADLLSQYEVLAPNSTFPYQQRFWRALLQRDEAAAASVVDAARHAKALDTSEAATERKRWIDGVDDDKRFERLASEVARFDEVIAAKTDAKTRATALWLSTSSHLFLGLYKNDPARLARGRDAAREAEKLWPVFRATVVVVTSLLDEAGLAADATTWSKMRRERGAEATLDALNRSHSPIADAIRRSKQWPEIVEAVAAAAKVQMGRPTVDDLRLARLIGDPAVVTRAQAALDDKLVRLGLELGRLLDPTGATEAEDLAYLDKR